jgi:lipopolysaccharide export system protein LptA
MIMAGKIREMTSFGFAALLCLCVFFCSLFADRARAATDAVKEKGTISAVQPKPAQTTKTTRAAKPAKKSKSAKSAKAAKPADTSKPASSSNNGSAAKAQTSNPAEQQKINTQITSDRITYTANNLQVVFLNAVHVRRPDFELWTDKLTIYLKPSTEKQETAEGGTPTGMAAGDIERMVAEGNVRITSEGGVGTSAQATYTTANGLLVMSGSPKLMDKENMITGDVIRYYMNENRSEVISGHGKQVEAVFTTSGSSGRGGSRQ